MYKQILFSSIIGTALNCMPLYAMKKSDTQPILRITESHDTIQRSESSPAQRRKKHQDSTHLAVPTYPKKSGESGIVYFTFKKRDQYKK